MVTIPKIIHYCWFGNNVKSELILKCIDSWEKYLPNYEIIEWNEFNSQIFKNKFYIDALRKKQYAFVSDYIRTKVMYEYGGLYFDTDMLLLGELDNSFLEYDFFTAYEEPGRVSFGLFGSTKKHRFLKSMLDFYEKTEFDKFNPPVITVLFCDVINENTLTNNERIFAKDYFYSLPYNNRGENYNDFKTENSIAIHLWNHSWKQKIKKSNFYYWGNLFEVAIDFIFHNYSRSYFLRYVTLNIKKIFSRK